MLLELIVGSDSEGGQSDEVFESDCRKAIEIIERNTRIAIEHLAADPGIEGSSRHVSQYDLLRQEADRLKEPFLKALMGEVPRGGLRVVLPYGA